jgi:cellobiose phosphorylase
MYRLIIESLLGVTRNGQQLVLAPRMPAGWDTYTLTYRHGGSSYVIRVVQSADTPAPAMTIDGAAQQDQVIALNDTGAVHQVELLLPLK